MKAAISGAFLIEAIISKSDSRTIITIINIIKNANTIGSKVCRKNDKLEPLLWISVVSTCFGPDSWVGIDWINDEPSVTVVVKSIKNTHF